MLDGVHDMNNLFDDLNKHLNENSQVIISSKLNQWRTSHHEIFENQTREFVFFGALMDLAIVGNAKLDVIFADRAQITQPTSNLYKLDLMLGTHYPFLLLLLL